MGRPSSGGPAQGGFVQAKRTTMRRRRKDKATGAKPIKVVYISNPMRVTTSAAKFRGLVQRLTGRDSTVADFAPVFDSPSFAEFGGDYEDDDDGAEELSAADAGPGSGAAAAARGCDDEEALWRRHHLSSEAALADQCKSEEAAAFEVFDDAFAPVQMLEQSPPAGLPQSPSLCCEPLFSRWILETL